MTVDDVINRIGELPVEEEVRLLEGLLLGLTLAARFLCGRNLSQDKQLRILIQINEINHRLLNRVHALRGGDSFFTVRYTWKAVEEHFVGAPGLREAVLDMASAALESFGV